jgi:hypothetical protein
MDNILKNKAPYLACENEISLKLDYRSTQFALLYFFTLFITPDDFTSQAESACRWCSIEYIVFISEVGAVFARRFINSHQMRQLRI